MTQPNAITGVVETVSNNQMSIFHLITSADIVGKSVMFLLFLLSIWSWAILFDKYIKYKNLKKKIQKFESLFWSGQVLDHLYEKIRLKADHPLSQIFVAAINEWKRDTDRKIEKYNTGLRIGLKDRIMQTMELIRNREVEKLEEGLSFLATVGSSAPFIGLFGTVWGIMHSFQSIAASKNTTLAVVAPGIAEALLATAIGLFAAIPAVIFYNYLVSQLNSLSNKIDDFISELYTLLSRAIDEEKN
jgi:biopolymer transport protein TolQ